MTVCVCLGISDRGQVSGWPWTGTETLIGFRRWKQPLQMWQKNKTVIDKDVKCDPHVSLRSCSISRTQISIPACTGFVQVLFCLFWCCCLSRMHGMACSVLLHSNTSCTLHHFKYHIDYLKQFSLLCFYPRDYYFFNHNWTFKAHKCS